MSIKQGNYLKELRTKRNLSQEKLSEELGISRQSISKWEQGNSAPDIDNIIKLSEFFGVSADSIIKGEANVQTNTAAQTNVKKEITESPSDIQKNEIKKRGWFFTSYPIFTIIIYLVLGFLIGPKGWYIGWIIFLTIPLYYSGVYAIEKKNPLIFAFPFLAAIIYLLCGFLLSMWGSMWIVFLTIPIYYIIALQIKNSKRG